MLITVFVIFDQFVKSFRCGVYLIGVCKAGFQRGLRDTVQRKGDKKLDVAAHEFRGLVNIQTDIAKPSVSQQLRQFWADIRIRSPAPHRFAVEPAIEIERRFGWVAEVRRRICILDDDPSARAKQSCHPPERGGRVSQMGQDEARENHIDRLIENKSKEIDMSVGQIVEPRLDRLAARDLKRLSIEVDCNDSPSRANSGGQALPRHPRPQPMSRQRIPAMISIRSRSAAVAGAKMRARTRSRSRPSSRRHERSVPPPWPPPAFQRRRRPRSRSSRRGWRGPRR